MRLRTVAGDKPSLDILEIVRDPTGSPVVMCVLISSASISRLRSSISDPLLIISYSNARAFLAQLGLTHYDSAQLGLTRPSSAQLSMTQPGKACSLYRSSALRAARYHCARNRVKTWPPHPP